MVWSLVILMAACAPTSGGAPAAGAAPTVAKGPQRTVVMAIRLEPNTLALRPPRETFANIDHNRLFNADFATVDDHAVPQPYLIEALPQLGTDNWVVEADGRMRTTYRLRPNLTWHDGTPMTAEDYVFAWGV
jgi:ABC-type transport system substrate-binding protein